MDAFLLFHPTFTEYEMLNDTDIPENVEKGYCGRGRGWPYLPQNGHHMALLVPLRVSDNTLRFCRLPNIAINAEEERVFHVSKELV